MADTMIDRVDKLLVAHGLSDRAASMRATGKPDLIRDMRRRVHRPKQDALAALAEVLETTVEHLRFGKATGAIIADRRTGYEAEPEPQPFGQSLGRTLPVYGTARGSEVRFDDDETIETHLLELTDAIDWVRRPPLLEGRRDVYALYISGTSMEPRHEPGDPVIVDPKRAPRPGDDVIVQLLDRSGEEVAVALIKRLVRQGSEFLELQQYNPPRTFRVPRDRVKALHRVMMMRDVIG